MNTITNLHDEFSMDMGRRVELQTIILSIWEHAKCLDLSRDGIDRNPGDHPGGSSPSPQPSHVYIAAIT
jgi:hypothetical protein